MCGLGSSEHLDPRHLGGGRLAGQAAGRAGSCRVPVRTDPAGMWVVWSDESGESRVWAVGCDIPALEMEAF